MPVEVRFEAGPFTSKGTDRMWLLLSVHEGDDEARQVVVRLGPALLEHVWGPRDPIWWFAARAGADRLHRDHTSGQEAPRTTNSPPTTCAGCSVRRSGNPIR